MIYHDGLKTLCKGSKSMVGHCNNQNDHNCPPITFAPQHPNDFMNIAIDHFSDTLRKQKKEIDELVHSYQDIVKHRGKHQGAARLPKLKIRTGGGQDVDHQQDGATLLIEKADGSLLLPKTEVARFQIA